MIEDGLWGNEKSANPLCFFKLQINNLGFFLASKKKKKKMYCRLLLLGASKSGVEGSGSDTFRSLFYEGGYLKTKTNKFFFFSLTISTIW